MRPIAVSACLLLTLTVFGSVSVSGQPNPAVKTSLVTNLSAVLLAFTKNMGQWPDSILFRANASGATMWFTRDGIYYQFIRRIPIDTPSGIDRDSAVLLPTNFPEELGAERDSIVSSLIKAEFVGASESAEVVGLEELDYKCNYFIGNDPAKWHTDVPNYYGVTFKDLYPGVDATFRGQNGKMEYELSGSVAALSQVRTEYRGARSIEEENDIAVLRTNFGERRFRGILLVNDSALVASTNVVNQTPTNVTLVYSTFLGGSDLDNGLGITVDGLGSAYVTGSTYSSNFPTITPLDSSWHSSRDAFITKLSPDGNSLVYSTFLGGASEDRGFALAVDLAGSVYVTGETRSFDFPTQNPYDNSFNGGSYYGDAFVTKLSPGGSSLDYSTYLGGSSEDNGRGIAVDGVGSAYVTGVTQSANFPTAAPFDGTLSGAADAFVTKLHPAGNNLVYSTYLGGNVSDGGFGLIVDASGSPYVTGSTRSSDFPILNPYDGSYNGGTYSGDAFVTKLSPTGIGLIYSTYLGGSNDEEGYGIVVDGAGNAYITGCTQSSNFPTATPLDGTLGGATDAFVTKLNSVGNSLVYSSYLGGSNDDYSYGIAVDLLGSAYVTGNTWSSDFPTVAPFDSNLNTFQDAFVTRMNTTGNGLVYSTYLGGSGDGIGDRGYGIAVDLAGSAYVTGATSSSDFPTVNPYDSSFNGSWDAFVTKLSKSTVTTSSFLILDGARPEGQPIRNWACGVYKILPDGSEQSLGTVNTDTDGILLADPAWFSVGDHVKVEILAHTLESTRPFHEAVGGVAHEIWLDNAEVQSSGPLQYNDTYTGTSGQPIQLSHTTVKFNLVVAIEWQASTDYLENLKEAFRRVANYWYDVTDGQATLGRVAIFDGCSEDDPVRRSLFEVADVQVWALDIVDKSIPAVATGLAGYYGRPEAYDNNSWYCYKGNVKLPRVIYSNYVDRNPQLIAEYGLDWLARQRSYDGQFTYDPGVQGIAHELGHYLLYLGEEYPFQSPTCSGQHIIYNFGLMDNELLNNDPAAPRYGEMSADRNYGDAGSVETNQWCMHSASCWDWFQEIYEGGDWTVNEGRRYDGTIGPCYSAAVYPFAQIVVPAERGNLYPLVGPNNDIINPDVDCGGQLIIDVWNFSGNAADVVIRVPSFRAVSAVSSAMVQLRKPNSGYLMEQGNTVNGCLTVLGASPGDTVVLTAIQFDSLQNRQEYFFGAAPVGNVQQGDTVFVNAISSISDKPLAILSPLTAADAFMLNADYISPLYSVPNLTVVPEYGPRQIHPLSGVGTAYVSGLISPGGTRGSLLLSIPVDSARSFDIQVRYDWSRASLGGQVVIADGAGIGSTLVIDTQLCDISSVLLTGYSYILPTGGLPPGAVFASPAYGVAVYPSQSLGGASKLILSYAGFSWSPLEQSALRAYRWDHASRIWESVGGQVDTMFQSVSLAVESDGLYTLAVAPLSCCNGVRGNVNHAGIVDLSDLSALVSYLTGGGYVLPCPDEADINAVGIVDLSDLSALVNYLTGGGFVLPNCP